MHHRVFPLILAVAGTLWASIPVDSSAENRSWTSKFGSRVIKGEFVELRDGRLTLRKPDGSTIKLPISALITEDQEFAASEQAKTDLAKRVDVLTALKDRLIRMVDGESTPYKIPTEPAPTHVLFYVVSSLCDTCLEHSPRLKTYYEETLAPAPEVELVVVSLESDMEQQQEYLAGQRLPFPAVDVDAMAQFEAAITPRIFSKARDGCQTFILATADGKVLAKSALEPKREIARILKRE